MENVVLVIHLFLALAIIGLVLLQRSEGGGLGIGGGGGMGRLTTAKGAANILTRATGICAAAFFATSLLLGILAGQQSVARQGILDALDTAPVASESPVINEDAPTTQTAPSPAAEAVEEKVQENKAEEPEAETPKKPAAPIAE
jgi:preprotein translocase subunit SecG